MNIRRSARGLALVAVLAMSACASEPSIRDASKSASEDLHASGTIVAIDRDTRDVTLRGELGNELVVHADEGVRNFDQLQVGDVVDFDYRRSIVVDLAPGGSGEAGASVSRASGRTGEGEAPAASESATLTVLAPIVAIDEAAHTVTVEGPDGGQLTFDVARPEYQAQLHKLELGELVRIRYTEAAAISIRAQR